MTAAFEHIAEADQIGVDIARRIDQRVAHAGLSREVHHIGKAVRGKQCRHPRPIGKIEPRETERGKAASSARRACLSAGS